MKYYALLHSVCGLAEGYSDTTFRWINDLDKAGIGIVARESLANGFLSGSVRRDSTFTPGTLNARYTREEIEARVERVEALSFLVRHPVENMAQAALRWVLDNPCISLVLTGAKNAAEVRDGSKAALWPAFTREEIDRAARLHLSDQRLHIAQIKMGIKAVIAPLGNKLRHGIDNRVVTNPQPSGYQIHRSALTLLLR